MLFVSVDIDGTLLDVSKRMAEAGKAPDKSDMKAFQAWLDKLQPESALLTDEKFWEMLELLRVLEKDPDVYVSYLTGRSEKYRDVTLTWLQNNGFPDFPLHMRKLEDERSAADVKRDVLTFFNSHYRPCMKLAIDDDYDGDVSAVYKELGYLHLKVMS